MRPVKFIVLYILCFNFFPAAVAQHKSKVPAGVNALFDDLPIDDPAQNSVLRPGEDSVQKIKKNIFVTGITSTTHCFLGEPVLLTYTLYSALQSTSTIDKAPSFAGFSVNAMTADNEQVKRKKQNGKDYRVFTVQQLQLVPLQEGVLTIEPISIYNEVQYTENEKEYHYGGGVSGKAIAISVDPLPVAGRPADFSGATGNVTLQAAADTSMAAGENNMLHITVEGTGNFAAVSVPEIIWPAGCEHFSVNTRLQMNKGSFPPSGRKIFDIPFVPSKQGTLVIPAMQLSFFDTQKKMYRIVYSNRVVVHVAPAVHAPGAAILPKKKTAWLYYLLPAALIVLLYIPIVFYRRKKNKTRSIEKRELPEPAMPAATVPERIDVESELNAVRALGSTREYVTAFKNLLTDCLRQYTGITAATEEILQQQLQIKDATLATAAGHLYTQCNNLLYAPGDTDTDIRKDMEEQLVAISKRADEVLPQEIKIKNIL